MSVRFVYVIMPIGSDPHAEEKKLELGASINECGREAIFPAYSLDQPSFSVHDFIENMHSVDSVLVDLSHERPSCYYELGIVEAIGKQVHLIAQSGTPIHQCSSRHAVNYYSSIGEIQQIVRSVFNKRANGS